MPNKQRILIVENHDELRFIIVKLLKYQGFYAVPAPSAKEAIDRLQKCNFALVLSDIQMPTHDGFWLLEEIKRGWPALPVYLMSAAADLYRCQGLQCGAEAVLQKPLDIDFLTRKIRAACTGSSYQVF